MRDIKTRAWDKEAEIMVYSDHRTRKYYDVAYGFVFVDGIVECQWEGEAAEYCSPDGGTLDNIMQYTGLKDDNGIEIYEGDILHLECTNDWEAVVRFGNPNYSYSWGWQLEPINFATYHNIDILLWVETEQPQVACTIIGNIYQNKDLLIKLWGK